MSFEFLYYFIYTLFLVFIWWFFVILRIHALKFKNFQTKIVTFTKALCISLIILSILGYILLYYIVSNKTYWVKKIDKINNSSKIEQELNNVWEEIY